MLKNEADNGEPRRFYRKLNRKKLNSIELSCFQNKQRSKAAIYNLITLKLMLITGLALIKEHSWQ